VQQRDPTCWLVPEGNNSDVYAEATSTLVGVVSTFNEHLVGDESEDESGDEGEGEGEKDAVPPPPPPSSVAGTWEARAGAFVEAVPWPMCLSLLAQVGRYKLNPDYYP
jgi:hypothetical protein